MTENDSSLFSVDIENYNGPLDILLDLAKSQKVNLENISITKLADQFHDFITNQKNLNLESASEYLLMATWLAYLKSKLLLPGTPEEEFKVQEVAEKLKLQLKKLELIRLLSDQMLKRKRLGKDIFLRGMKGSIKSIYSSKYSLTLFEVLKAYMIGFSFCYQRSELNVVSLQRRKSLLWAGSLDPGEILGPSGTQIFSKISRKAIGV